MVEHQPGKKARLTRGEIRIGGAPAELPQTDQLRLRMDLEQLDLGPWLDRLKTPGGRPLSMPDVLIANISRLQLMDTQLSQVSLDLNRTTHGWEGPLSSHRFQGRVQIPANIEQTPLRLNLDRLDLDLEIKEDKPPSTPSVFNEELDPRRFPGLALDIKRLRLNSRELGSVSLIVRKAPQGLVLEPFSLIADDLTLHAEGYWLLVGRDKESKLRFNLHTEGLGELLADLGYTQQIGEAPATIDSNLGWKGSPLDFDLGQVVGELRLHVGEGRFREINPGVGRIFGLLNIGALQRRLSLDFTDLFRKGFSFDRIEGHFTLEEGHAYTNDLTLDSPSAGIMISGRTGLVDKDYDQLVTITPRVTGSLPLAGAIAGGPAVGAALFFAQKILGKEVDKISRKQYRVTGPWSDPAFELQPLFDTAVP